MAIQGQARETMMGVDSANRFSPEVRLTIAEAIRDRIDPADIVAALLNLAQTSKNGMVSLGAYRLLIEAGWGRPKQQIEVTRVTADDAERRRFLELLHKRAPDLLEQYAGWAERVPAALPATVDASPGDPCAPGPCLGPSFCPGLATEGDLDAGLE
jgi:hypothetical protein